MNKVPKLTKKQESDACLACGECCKRYAITVLPEEAAKIARLLGKPKKVFLDKDCVLHVKLFPKTTPGVLTFPATFFPKRIFELIKKESPLVSDSFFVVPQVVLRREEKNVFSFKERKTKSEKRNACAFIDAVNKCQIYDARPAPCRLFPFIAVPGFREQYPFCGLYQKTFKDYSAESRSYYKKVQEYFKRVDKKGFGALWINPPVGGQLFLQDKFIGSISLEELAQMMPRKE